MGFKISTVINTVTTLTYAEDDGVTAVVIPDGVDVIGRNAFKNCKQLESVEISDSVATIGSCAFWGCTGLKNITIPAGVKVIEDNAFCDCTSLESLTIAPKSLTKVGANVFTGSEELKVLHIGEKNFYCRDLSILDEYIKAYCLSDKS